MDRYDITKERQSLFVEHEQLESDQMALQAKVRLVNGNLSKRTRALYDFENRLFQRLKGNAPLTETEMAELRREIALFSPSLE